MRTASRASAFSRPRTSRRNDVVRHVLADAPASLGVERAGWIGFSVRLATPALMARGLTPVSGLGFEAIVARVVARARETSSLTYFAEASRHPGFVPALARTLDEVRRAALSAESLDDGTTMGRDLASLLVAVEAAMARTATRRSRRRAGAGQPRPCSVTRAATSPCRSSWSTRRSRSRRDVALAQALVARSRDALVTAPDGDAWVRRLMGGLAMSVDVIDPADHATTPEALRRVQLGLFRSSDAVFQTAATDSSVECLSAPGEGRECVEVARVVLEHAERGTRFDRMAVVMRSPELYASHLETALRRADVPAYFGRGTRRPDPAGRAMLALLACAAEDLSARRFAEYLSLGQVPSVGRASRRGSSGPRR